MCQEYEESLRTTCKGARNFDKWQLALCQHPMLLLIKEDELCAEREADWGGDLEEEFRRLEHNLELLDIHPSLSLCYDFAVVELELVKEQRPDLYEKFRKHLQKRRITFVNGSYSQPHMNIMGHESCYKQIEEGCRTFNELFGEHPRTYATQEPCYIEQLPQILRAFRYDHAVLSHFAWSLKFLSPHELLGYRGRLHFLDGEEFTNWTAPDGTALPLYLADVGGPLHGFIKDQGIYWEYQKDLLRAPTLRVGYPDLIDLPPGWLEANEKNGSIVLIDDTLDERLKKFPPQSSARLIPTFSYQAEGIDGSRLSVLNRRAETLLNQLRAIDLVLDEEALDQVRSYRHIWKLILKCQHHDAYWPGGPGLRKKAEAWLTEINNEMAKKMKRQMKLLGKNISASRKDEERMLVFNSLPYRRTGLARANLSADSEHLILDSHGVKAPSQVVPALGSNNTSELLSVVKIDGLGYKSVQTKKTTKGPAIKLMKRSTVFENKFYFCKVRPDLTFSSLVCSKTGQQLLKKGSCGNEWRGLGLDGKWITTRGNAENTIINEGPLGKILTASFTLPKAEMKMRAMLLNELPWIEFEAVLDADGFSVGDYWKNMSKLCILWPLATADAVRYEVPFGSVEGRQRRPLIALGWVDARVGESALSYFNAGTPGHFLDNAVLRNIVAWGADTDNFNSRIYGSMKYQKKFDLSLRGRYHYRWAVMPHSPRMSAGQLTALCRSWMEPPLAVIAKCGKGNLKPGRTYLSIGPGLVPVAVEKDCEAGGCVKAMVYEPNGRRTKTTFRSNLPKASASAESLDGTKITSFAPHKIGWIKIRSRK